MYLFRVALITSVPANIRHQTLQGQPAAKTETPLPVIQVGNVILLPGYSMVYVMLGDIHRNLL